MYIIGINIIVHKIFKMLEDFKNSLRDYIDGQLVSNSKFANCQLGAFSFKQRCNRDFEVLFIKLNFVLRVIEL